MPENKQIETEIALTVSSFEVLMLVILEVLVIEALAEARSICIHLILAITVASTIAAHAYIFLQKFI